MGLFGKQRAVVGRRYHQKRAHSSEPAWVAEVVAIVEKSGVRYIRFFSWQDGVEMTPVERTVKEDEFFQSYE